MDNGTPSVTEHGKRFRRSGFIGALVGLFAVATGKAQADTTPPTGQPGTYPLLVNGDNFGQRRTALASPAADETLEITNFGQGSALVAIAGGGTTVAQNVTTTSSVLGWNAGVAAPGVGGGFFKTSGDLPGAGLVVGLLPAGDTPDQFLSPVFRAAGVFTTGPPPVVTEPTPATTTASVVGWNADVDSAGVAGGFFKTAGGEPSAGILVGLLQAGQTPDQLLPPVDAAGIFLDGVANNGLGANAVTMTAAHFAFSERNTSSAAITEEGTAIFAQVLGKSGTGGVFTQPSPGGDALVVDGRGVFSRSFQQTIARRQDSFTVLDAFVTPRTVALTNFTSDPRDVRIKMVTLNPGQSVVFTLNRRTERAITVNGVLFN